MLTVLFFVGAALFFGVPALIVSIKAQQKCDYIDRKLISTYYL